MSEKTPENPPEAQPQGSEFAETSTTEAHPEPAHPEPAHPEQTPQDSTHPDPTLAYPTQSRSGHPTDPTLEYPTQSRSGHPTDPTLEYPTHPQQDTRQYPRAAQSVPHVPAQPQQPPLQAARPVLATQPTQPTNYPAQASHPAQPQTHPQQAVHPAQPVNHPAQPPYPPQPAQQSPAQPMPVAQSPRRRRTRSEDLVPAPVTGSAPLTHEGVTEIPADGPIEWPRKSIGVVGVANLFLSAIMAVIWAWIPLVLLFTGIGGIFALGLGVLALVGWVIVQQGANVFERYRAELVYGDGIPVPTRMRNNREPGFTRFIHNLWLLVKSGSFWRSTAHHYLKMLLGGVIVGGTVAAICASIFAIFGAINPEGVTTFFLGGPAGGLGRVGVAVGALIVLGSSLAILWFAPYLDRALDRSLLPPARTAALQEEVTELDRARMAGIEAAAAERLRIERDLHDGAQPRLVALSMTLGMAKAKIDSDPERAKELVSEAHAEAKGIVNELRQLARGIHPAVLTDRGLDAAVSALAGRSPIPVDVDVRLDGRIEREAEAVAYFVVAECLTNIAKHAHASHARVLIAPIDHAVQIVVTDNGRGEARIDRSGRHTGLAGLVDRVEAARGTLNLTSPTGGPTTVVVEVPCAS
ncbi:histidine kinase [Brevibacterium sp.]|uniref:histidine kinase n=1 Tax=Brevibacterium sp. TaxID=1701 RepID=UPI0028117D7B|nr:histidine kinase [Brevibacterium sp.]